ncbi:hypothetical protein MNBD_ALPHA03-88 [hydrothermal vent metagenome]|uniref:Magnesium transporter MgtE intracellular domain-containing protein n=1 Tax=hydrothermal vent metagenome TaxID=652676 RepID=A0A3B1AQ77_9ZZZZ
MLKKIRVISLAIILMSMVLGIKIVDFSFGVQNAVAQATEPEKENAPEEEKAGSDNNEQTADEAVPLQLSGIPSRKEIEYLQKLAERRQELDRRAREMDDREKLLEAVEKRIVERTGSLKKIKETIEALLAKHDEIEKAQLVSLVKMYSAMKPKEAAGIFNNLDSDVLISIVENMKESKMGAILAKMNINKAKKLTTDLAVRKQLPKIDG